MDAAIHDLPGAGGAGSGVGRREEALSPMAQGFLGLTAAASSAARLCLGRRVHGAQARSGYGRRVLLRAVPLASAYDPTSRVLTASDFAKSSFSISQAIDYADSANESRLESERVDVSCVSSGRCRHVSRRSICLIVILETPKRSARTCCV